MQAAMLPVFSGVLLGYLVYDCVHYAIHHAHDRRGWLAGLKRAHLAHHFRAPRANFGISSGAFDVLLRTRPAGWGA
jgi:sterol desaturase/sphingolipid hydroxylase (fatty acid hydroxylase superfamily)